MADSRLEQYQQLLEADPASMVFVDLASELLQRGKAARAVEVCTAGLAHHPEHVEARILCGRALLRLGRATDARTHFEAALAARPRDPEVHATVGEALLDRGLQRSALQLFKKARALAPGDERIEALLARAEGGAASSPSASKATAADPAAAPTTGAAEASVPAPERVAAAAPVPVEESATTPLRATTPPPPASDFAEGVPPPETTAVDELSGWPNDQQPVRKEAAAAGGDDAAPSAEQAAAEDDTAPAGASETPARPAGPPPLTRAPATPPPIRREPTGEQPADDLLGALPAPPQEPPAPPQPEPSVVAEEAANVAAVYERELRERLAAEQARPPSWLRRHRLGISLGLLLATGGGAAWAAYEYRRAATHADDVARYTAAARNGLLRDTRAAYEASLTALDEVLDREEHNPTARALRAQVIATLAKRYGSERVDAAEAPRLLGPAEVAAEPEVVLATRLLLAEPAERKSIEEAILAADPGKAGATVHSLAGAILLERGDSAAAIERFNAAVASVPGHVPTLVHVADYYRERHEHSEALRYDRLALAVVEDHPLALLGAAEAQLALAKERAPLEEALAGLSRVGTDAVPAAERSRYVQVKARLLASLGRREEALAVLEPLRAGAAGDAELLPALADTFVAVGAPDRAEELFRVDAVGSDSPLRHREAWARALLARERYKAVTAVPAGKGERSLQLLKGIAWYRSGSLDRARSTLRRTATRQAGKMPVEAVVYLALADLQSGRLDKARRNLERLGTGSRAKTTGRWAYAALLVREGRLDEAEAALREAVGLDRDSVEARCALGRLLLRRGDAAGARAALEEALARNPFHAEARTALGAAALAAGDLPGARKALAAAVEQAPDDAEALAALALLEAREGKAEEAQRRIAQAKRRGPREAAVLAARAELALRDGESRAAIALLEQATRADGSDPRLWIRLGELRLAAGAARPARLAYGRALDLQPASAAAQLGAARAQVADGQAAAAAKRLEGQVARLGDDAAPALRGSLLVALAAVERSLERSGARAHAEEAVAIAPDSATAHLALGEILAAAGDQAGAETHLRKARELDGESPEILRALGLHLLAHGDRPEGEKLLARYLRASPDGPSAREVRSRLGTGK
ncbi:tetratricopeptide repeat protein [Vulgatibacter sp.]|uniref:tetratricopeptide repeat protein n=1 Tax=Vulgatibacter sp. TaxID=1971226 RepID=UPI003568DC35